MELVVVQKEILAVACAWLELETQQNMCRRRDWWVSPKKYVGQKCVFCPFVCSWSPEDTRSSEPLKSLVAEFLEGGRPGPIDKSKGWLRPGWPGPIRFLGLLLKSFQSRPQLSHR